MGRIGAFKKVQRLEAPERDPQERVRDVREFVGTLPLTELREQAARCMECGVPFCHDGCPLGNAHPRAGTTSSTATGGARRSPSSTARTTSPSSRGGSARRRAKRRACSRSTRGTPSSIKQVERAIVDRAWDEGWIDAAAGRELHGHAASPSSAPGLRGSPARSSSRGAGERRRRLRARRGGRRARALRRARVQDREAARRAARRPAARRGRRVPVRRRRRLARRELRARHDAVVLAIGARVPRDLPVPAATSRASTSRWSTSTTADARSPARAAERSPRPASTCSSSAAATRAPTASRTRTAKALRR